MSENLKGRNQLEVLGIDGIILKWILEKFVGKVWTGFMWLKIETGGGLFHKRNGI
jgi:hypothetical protein